MKTKEILAQYARRRGSIPSIMLLILLVPAGVYAMEGVPGGIFPASTDQATRELIVSYQENLPLFFVPNEGQSDPRVLFTCIGGDFTQSFLSDGRIAYSVPCEEAYNSITVVQRFLGGNPDPVIEGLDPLSTRVSYFSGDVSQWHTNITPFGSIAFRDIYEGIDLICSGQKGMVKREFRISPGADPDKIRMRFEGASRVRMSGDGGLVTTVGSAEIRESAPICYQEWGERKVFIPCRFDVHDDDTVSFYIGPHDPDLPLTIDPVLSYCGYIGGSENDFGYGIAVDAYGNAYIAGSTSSPEGSFPYVVGPSDFYAGSEDAFIAKVNPSGTGLVYCGYIGGMGRDGADGVAVDAAGNAYVVGGSENTASWVQFPTTVGPDVTPNGEYDAFIAKVNAAGTSLDYCGYIGGEGTDIGNSIAVDVSGNAYVTGYTESSESSFPQVAGPDPTYNGGAHDAYVARVNQWGTGLTYCGYLGGAGNDYGYGIAVDTSGNAYVTGSTDSTSFPTAAGPDLSQNGGYDAFVTKVNSAGTGLIYSGYIGGSGIDYGYGIAVDATGAAYVTGYTESAASTFPETVGPDLSQNGGADAFVAKVNPAGSALTYSGFIGGSGTEWGNGIALDYSGNAYVTGYTTSAQASFPVVLGPDITQNGGADAFVAKIKSAGTGLDYCGYIGGSGDEQGNGIALDTSRKPYIAGSTTSLPGTFPVRAGPAITHSGASDAFVAKIGGGKPAIGIWRPSNARWYLDYDSNGLSNYQVTWGASTDIPVTGDWDRDGFDEIGLWRPSTARWYLDYDNNGLSNYQVTWGASADKPVTGDWDNDGKDEIGLFRPSTARWYLDYDNNGLYMTG